ncbi:hypothetical protein A0J48_004100 [Sphaerospermopsis aphanizomenoides BCCUSP55]|uniref:hypothetical protein n=1 Tax=Sphaerospermopsis aphanizomenoides TaxID=459663 RepID=UPI00190646C3|nr:hypothetical protein [Sphaerospermopsis aphanizomenoides]MBK1986730.1 hypothetical protein [Sphaerospermopsis aphanizomenoides BCCUSP55]
MPEEISSKKIYISVLGDSFNVMEAIESILVKNRLHLTISRAAMLPCATLSNDVLSAPGSYWYGNS